MSGLICIASSTLAREAFSLLAEKVTGTPVSAAEQDDGVSDLVLIGSDTENPVLHRLTEAGELPFPGVRAGSEDFRIFSVRSGTRRILVLSGGRARATLYAVYTYFERFCGCRYFWDGDVAPERSELPLEAVDFRMRFRYQYRAIRYFAHRSLHRFQAEHWDWEDWKREIDYLVKRRFNLFMLRIGIDDIFQKAFPEFVGYPPDEERDPGAVPRTYNDRTTFRPLRERGELRKKILSYAFECDLLHPEDIGPVTHWYTPTPLDFLEHVKPKFLNQSQGSYQALPRLQVWDCADDRNLELYFRLAEAHIEHYGQGKIFHTIGLAERGYGDREQNYQLKSYTLRRFIRKLREHYPSAPLLLASWDFLSKWHPDEVRRLFKEIDWENTLLLDYTTDCDFRGNNFMTWGVPRHIPWIFGVFEGYEPNNDLFFDFSRPLGQLDAVGDDPMCKGVALWAEMSHANPLVLELISKIGSGEPFSVETFCRDRYGARAEEMLFLWKLSRETFATGMFTNDPERPGVGGSIFPFRLLAQAARPLTEEQKAIFMTIWRTKLNAPELPHGFFSAAAELARLSPTPFVFRDLLDLTRTFLAAVIGREIAGIHLELALGKRADGSRLIAQLSGMADLLETHPDYSMWDSFKRLGAKRKIHPLSEEILKGGGENGYCRSYIYELFRAVYLPEAECFARVIAEGVDLSERSDFLLSEAEKIRENFYRTPLESLRPDPARGTPERLAEVLDRLETLY